MTGETYTFPCGCRLPVLGPPPREGALPALLVTPQTLPENLGCKAVWDLLATGRTKGIFQLESQMAREWTKKLKPESDEHVGALGAILRPGCLNVITDSGVSVTESYCRRKNGLEEVVASHPALEGPLKATFYLMLYQEQMMRIAADVAGFSKADQGKLRKCVTGDTRLVSRTRGWVTIERLVCDGYADDEFLVMDERGRSRWGRIADIWSNGKKSVRKVLSRSGSSVWATKHHQFLTVNGWKARSRLTTDDYLVATKRVSYDGRETVGRDMAVVVAGIVTEGSFVDGKQARFTNYDPFMMNTFCEAAERCFGRRPTPQSEGKVVGLLATERDRVAQLIPFGKSRHKRLAECMMGETLETTRDFLSFLLAAEGGVTVKTGHFDWCSKSPVFAEQVRLLLLRFGVRSVASTFEVEGYGEFSRLGIADVRDQKVLDKELTGLWPDWKKEDLRRHLGRKHNFTTDVVPQSIVKKMIDQYPFCANYESGTAHTSPLSRERFARMAAKTEDKEWSALPAGNQWYDRCKSTDEVIDSAEVFDFTMEDESAPYVVANGLVIHNCAGKKDQSLMSKMGIEFVKQATALGKVTQEEAEAIFEDIKKSARYLFNRSHSQSYGLTGLETAWVKAHLPVAFFAGWLANAKCDTDPRKEMFELVGDSRVFGVPILPPDARTLRPSVSTDGISVRFGLSDARGTGDDQVKTLAELVRKGETACGLPSRDWTWPQWLGHALLPVKRGIRKNVAESWIGCGAFDFTGLSRARMQKEYAALHEFTEREHPKLRELLDTADSLTVAMRAYAEVPRKEGGPSSSPRRTAILDAATLLDSGASSDADHPNAVAGLEEFLLGVALTTNRVDGCDISMRNWTCRQFNEGKVSKRMVLAVEVKDARPKRTKKGDQMVYLTLDDGTDSLEATMFPKEFAEYKPLIYPGNCLIAEGYKDQKFGSFIAQKVYQLRERLSC